MMGDPLLLFDRVSCRRGGRRLFSDLSFAVAPGGALLLHGPNGAGKSSLIRMAAGLLAAESGRVRRMAGVALLAHESALDEARSLEEALGFWSRLDGARGELLHQALDDMGLRALSRVPARFLSSGQKRRAALARVIATGSALWLLDEPGVGLDSASLTLLAAAIARHRAAGGAVVAATHMDVGIRDAEILDLGSSC